MTRPTESERRGHRLLLRRSVTLLVNNGVGQGLAFLASVAISRWLGVPAFGEYATVMAIIFVASVAAEAGIEASLTREIARDPGSSRPLLVGSVRAKLAVGGAIALLLALPPVTAALAPGGSLAALWLAGPLLTLNAINSSFSAVFRAWGRMGYVLAINIVGQGVQLIGVIAVLIAAPTVPAVVAWFVVVQVGELAAGIALFRRGEPRALAAGGAILPGVADPDPHARALLRRSLPFALAGVLGTLEMRADLFVVQILRGAVAVAAYSVAMRLTEALGLAANAILPVLYPALAAAHGDPERGGESRLYARALGYVVAAAAAAAATGVLLAGPLVRLTFGPAYAAAAAPLRVLAVTLVPLLANRATTLRMYAQGRERFANAMDGADLVVRSGLGWVLVGAWGPLGAASANLVAEAVVLLVYALSGAMGRARPQEVERCSAAPPSALARRASR